MSTLRNVKFVKSVFSLKDLPKQNFKQICFVGRSNVGKSSLINALTNNSNMAKTSKTAGCTRSLNFFMVDERIFIVDLPGYGYAKANKQIVYSWNDLIINYLKTCRNLSRVFLLIDSRHWLKKNDIQVMDMLDDLGISYQIILTKIDKIKKSDLENIEQLFQIEISRRPAMYPQMLNSSSHKRIGVGQIIKTIMDISGDK
jgi:GTP-binding protein